MGKGHEGLRSLQSQRSDNCRERGRLHAAFAAPALQAIAMAIGLVFGAAAMAQSMSKDQYRSAEAGIAANYKAGKAACELFYGHANDLCMTEADGDERVARAELDARYEPSVRAAYEVLIARAEARYAIAIEKCADRAGSVRDDCARAAWASVVAAKADAQMQMKSALANEESITTSSRAYDEVRTNP